MLLLLWKRSARNRAHFRHDVYARVCAIQTYFLLSSLIKCVFVCVCDFCAFNGYNHSRSVMPVFYCVFNKKYIHSFWWHLFFYVSCIEHFHLYNKQHPCCVCCLDSHPLIFSNLASHLNTLAYLIIWAIFIIICVDKRSCVSVFVGGWIFCILHANNDTDIRAQQQQQQQ